MEATFSLLNLNTVNQKVEKKEEKGTQIPSYFLDLNIDQILDRVTEDWGEDIRNLYESLPENRETEIYRREIFQDVKKEGVAEALLEFLHLMKKRNQCLERKEKVEDELQKQVWHLREVDCYIEALELLKKTLNEFKPESAGLTGLGKYIEEYTTSENYIAFRDEVQGYGRELRDFRILITYEKNRYTVSEGKGSGAYECYLQDCFPGHEGTVKSPFLASFDLSDLEWEFMKVFKKKHKEFFAGIEKLYKKRSVYYEEDFLRLQKELAYYIAYIQFMEKMKDAGFAFCTPQESDGELRANGLYDLALACASMEENREVVSNHMELWKEESFFVLTGPNQGGKTTFARSLGQLVYFTKMGLDAPAVDANVPYYSNLLTHFSVEESVETGRGKLMDELVRLLPMMGDEKEEAFVVINELFTTAANYDACIMGKKVLEYFISHKCKGIYVTHLNELTEAHEKVVSLRATLDENLVQTFRIERSPAMDIAGANRQVEKYKLTYAQIKERFS